MLFSILKKILTAIPVLLVVSIVLFLLLNVMPGDAADSMSTMDATAEEVEALRESLGLNDPMYADPSAGGELAEVLRQRRRTRQGKYQDLRKAHGKLLELRIEDTSSPFPEDVLAALEEMKRTGEDTEHKLGFGLAGTIRRLSLLYGDDYDFILNSN